MNINDAFIVAYGRSPIGKAYKGIFKDTWPDEYAAQVIKGTLEKYPSWTPLRLMIFCLAARFQKQNRA